MADEATTGQPEAVQAATEGVRRKLPPERQSITRRFTIGNDVKLYATVGMWEDGTPGEVFCRIAREGSTISGLVDGACIAFSIALQYGAPLSVLCRKWTRMNFEPSGWTGDDEFGYAKSVLDLLARWMWTRWGVPEGTTASLQPPRNLPEGELGG